MATRTRTKFARPAKEPKAAAAKKPARKSKAARAPKHKDAKLLALWEQFEDSDKARVLLDARSDAAFKDGCPKDVLDAADEAADAAYKLLFSVLDQIDSTPAKTVDGIKVKAKAFAWIHSEGLEEFLDDETTDHRLVRQIMAGLLTV